MGWRAQTRMWVGNRGNWQGQANVTLLKQVLKIIIKNQNQKTNKYHKKSKKPQKPQTNTPKTPSFTTRAIWWSFYDPPWLFAYNRTTPYNLTCVYMPAFTQESETETEQACLEGQREKKIPIKLQCPRASAPCSLMQAEACNVYEKVRQLCSFLKLSFAHLY